MFYLDTKQRSDLILLSIKILLLSFVFSTSVLVPQNIHALYVSQGKENAFVSSVIHLLL